MRSRADEIDAASLIDRIVPAVDFVEVRGQEAAKRAVTIAAAGVHNIIMIGPAGTGKTMMAKALPGILPPMTRHESARDHTHLLERRSGAARPAARPSSARSHAAPHGVKCGDHRWRVDSAGGGGESRPSRCAVLRRVARVQPPRARDIAPAAGGSGRHGGSRLRHVSVSREVHAGCGAQSDAERRHGRDDAGGQHDMEAYLSRISGPFIDRIDIHVEVPGVSYAQLTSNRPGT